MAILEDMSSLRPPLDHLCELLPRLQARYYSIASSSKVSSDKTICTLHILQLTWETLSKEQWQCSQYKAHIFPTSPVGFSILLVFLVDGHLLST